jgi:hypothetical protein
MPMVKNPKARTAADCQRLHQLPNVGPAMVRDLLSLGIEHPAQLSQCDGYTLYRRLEAVTGQAQDPCVLDTFLAIVDFMQGAEPQPWWHYTAARKQRFGALHLAIAHHKA